MPCSNPPVVADASNTGLFSGPSRFRMELPLRVLSAFRGCAISEGPNCCCAFQTRKSVLTKDDCLQVIKKFRAKYALDASDENVIATIHLMNTHGIDIHAALDQSSRSSNDNGIDAWYFDELGRALFIR